MCHSIPLDLSIKSASHNQQRSDLILDVIGMSFPSSVFTQNARSCLWFHNDMKQESLWAFKAKLALVLLGALVAAMKASEVVMAVITLKASGVEVVMIMMKVQ